MAMALPCAVEMSSNTATTPSIEKTASSMAEHESYGRDQKIAPNQYKILSSKEILTRLMNLADSYPTFATLTTTQELYNLPRAGTRKDCRFDVLYDSEGVHIGCNNYVLIIQDKEAYPDDDCDIPLNVNDSKASLKSSGWKYIPDVFLSGSVHGNERVGPTAVIEAAELLLEAAYCESLSKVKTPVSRNNTEEIERAKECRASLSRRGISTHHRQWLARLVSTRRTVIIPTANALGYARNERREDGIDVNRDFPFDISGDKSSKCMQSIAARSINELFRSHLFPIGLTYHGGMEVVSYEWGAPTYWNQTAPDTYAQETIAKAYSRYGGKFATSPQYDYGPMNDKVYYVRGGMEDWAFAGSWDPDRVVRCQPMTYGGNYPPEKTIYNNSTLRAFNMLIETSDKKTPRKNSLGTRLDPLTDSDDENNGHVARNIRLALLAMDLAEPYVSIRQVDGMRIEDDVVPGIHPMNNVNEVKVSSRINHCGRNTRKTKTISWTVGGAFEIDSTDIIYGPWTIRHYDLVDAKDGFYPSAEALNLLKTDEFISVKPQNLGANVKGRSRWHENGSFPKSNVNKIDPNPIFEADIDISNFSNGTRLAVFARAKVDSSWARQPKSSFSALGAVSHIVNSRTNPSYFASNGGKIIKGREDNWWYSLPIIIVIGSNNEDDDMEYLSALPDCELEVIAINSRYGDMPDSYQLTMSRLSASRNNNFQDGSSLLGILALVLVMVVFAALVSLKEQRTHREQERRLHQVHLDYGSIS